MRSHAASGSAPDPSGVRPRTRRVTAPDGQVLTCEVRPAASADVLVFLPALGVPLRYYDPLLAAWAAQGRSVVGLEHRGQPLSPAKDLRRRPFGYSTIIHQDLPVVFALPEVRDADRVVVVGHSMGGALAVLATAAGVVAADAVVTLATGTSWCAAQVGVAAKVRRHAAAGFVAALAGLLGVWPGHRLGFGGRQPVTIMQDWAHEARHGRFELRGDPFDYEAALRRSTVPTLMVGVDDDPWVSARAVAPLGRRSPHGLARHQVAVGPGQSLGHFSWARRAPHLVIDPAERWLQDR